MREALLAELKRQKVRHLAIDVASYACWLHNQLLVIHITRPGARGGDIWGWLPSSAL